MRFGLVLLAAAALHARDPLPSYDRALERFNHTDYDGAAAILKTDPSDARSLELLGRCYLMEAHFGHAVNALEKAAALAPRNSMTLTWLGRAYAQKAETAFPLAAIGLANKARESFERALRIDPLNGEALDDLFEFYLQAPPVVGGGRDKARELIPAIAKIDPAQGEFARSRLAEDAKHYDRAESHLRRALELSSNKAGRLVDLAKFLSRRGRFEESDKAFEQAAAVAPDLPKIQYARADALIHARRSLPEASTLLAQFLRNPRRTPNDPSDAEAQRLLRKAEGG